MADVTICRICLNTGVTMYGYDRYYLKQYYEEIIALKVKRNDPLPNHFCYECAAMLHKFHKFKEKCWSGHQVLNKILSTGPITLKSISKVDRQINNLNSSISILNKSKKVRTYLMKSKTFSGSSNKEFNVEEPVEIVLPELSDDSLDDIPDVLNEEINDARENITQILLNDEVDLKVDIINIEEEEIDRLSDNEADEADKLSDNEIVADTFDDRIDSDDEKDSKSDILCNDDNIKIEIASDNNLEAEETVSIRKTRKSKQAKPKEKQFERRKKVHFDPKFWLKVNLNEEQAREQFAARSHDSKYLSAAYKCTTCYKGFSREDMLTRHMKLRHNELTGPVTCRFCNMKFRRPGLLTRHIAQHFVRYKCLRCDLVFDLKNTALFHNDYHNGVIRKCEHCGEEFRHQSTYYTHLRSHRSEHVCTVCGESFINEMGLTRHKTNMHLDTVANPDEAENTYCERCDVKFETRKGYDQHMFHSAKHGDSTEPIGLNTSMSPAPYKLNSNLTLKSLKRKPRKNTPCNICLENFSTYMAYMRHHGMMHPGAAVAPRDPGRGPGAKNDRYICEICGISLARCSVATHLNTHTREVRYTCGTCGKQFNSNTVLKQHQLTHTSEKPVGCPLCDKRFKQSSSMKLHYRTFHLKEPYPKRNRNKKNEDLLKVDEYGQDSDEILDRWR